MIIKLNNKTVEVSGNEPLITIARNEGLAIPSLCNGNEGAKHKSSCMVCVVKNSVTGQIIPSCTTLPTEGMEIETDGEELKLIRTLSLELLLADHRADCEAPCRMACPGGLDVAMMNRLYDAGKEAEALTFLRDSLVIPATLCYICNAPCEKICRKNDINTAVPIREIKNKLVATTVPDNIPQPPRNGKRIAVLGSDPAALSAAYRLRQLGYDTTLFEPSAQVLMPYIDAKAVPSELIELETECIRKTGVEIVLSAPMPKLDDFDGVVATMHENPQKGWVTLTTKTTQPARLVAEGKKLAEKLHASIGGLPDEGMADAKLFNSSYARFTEAEKQLIGEQTGNDHRKSECLYCDCDKKNNCKLRIHSTEYGIKNTRYTKAGSFAALRRQHVHGNMWFEQAKCIRCGLCVYNSHNGFTFKDRGYGMQVVLPEESKDNVKESLAEMCPTGALYVVGDRT